MVLLIICIVLIIFVAFFAERHFSKKSIQDELIEERRNIDGERE